jgi:GNAT superfamily N-acetyltransferase
MAAAGAPGRIRPATVDDIPSIRSLLAGHGNDGPVIYGDIVGPYVRHLIDHGRSLVSVVDDEVAGFAAAVDTGRGRHLADLFVRPDRLGQGIGRPLLDAVLDGAVDRTTFASDDPRAMPLYIRARMAPLWPGVYLEGTAGLLRRSAAGLPTEPASAARIADLEQAWTGEDRRVDHVFWASQVDADSFVVVDGGEVIGAGYARARQISPVRVLDRFVVRPEADPVAATLSAIRSAARDGDVRLCVPGPNPVLGPLLEMGFRIEERDTYMATSPDLIDPTRLLPNPGMR